MAKEASDGARNESDGVGQVIVFEAKEGLEFVKVEFAPWLEFGECGTFGEVTEENEGEYSGELV